MKKEDYEIWLEGFERVKYPRGNLPGEIEVLIVGGGITGITAAYLLSKAGKKVLLLEKGKLGEWVTDCTTGFLVADVDAGPKTLIKLFGINSAKLILESHKYATDEIEKIVKLENIECEFERASNFIYANNIQEEDYLKELVEIYKQLGINVLFKKDDNLKFNNFGYIEMPYQAKFHVMKYLTSLAKIAVKHGAIIAEDTEVIDLNDKTNSVIVNVKDFGNILAKKVMSATYSPFGKIDKLNHKFNMYRSYVIEYKIPSNTFTEGMYEDTLDPYHYFRIDKRNGFDRLIIGGNDNLNILGLDHEIGSNIIKNYTKTLFKNNSFEEIRHWSGLISEPTNRIANIGEYNNGNIFYAFGFNGSGLTYSYIAGKIFLDKLTNTNNPYSEIYKIKDDISWFKKLFL